MAGSLPGQPLAGFFPPKKQRIHDSGGLAPPKWVLFFFSGGKKIALDPDFDNYSCHLWAYSKHNSRFRSPWKFQKTQDGWNSSTQNLIFYIIGVVGVCQRHPAAVSGSNRRLQLPPQLRTLRPPVCTLASYPSRTCSIRLRTFSTSPSSG